MTLGGTTRFMKSRIARPSMWMSSAVRTLPAKSRTDFEVSADRGTRQPPAGIRKCFASLPTVPHKISTSPGSCEAESQLTAAPSPKSTRADRSIGLMYFEYVSPVTRRISRRDPR